MRPPPTHPRRSAGRDCSQREQFHLHGLPANFNRTHTRWDIGHSLVIGHWSLVILNRFPARPAEKEKRQARACLSIELNGQRVAYSGWAEMWPGLG